MRQQIHACRNSKHLTTRSFDEARLQLVMEQMVDAGVDPKTGLPVACRSKDEESHARLVHEWNHQVNADERASI